MHALWDFSLSTFGFVVITNHGISSSLLEEVYDSSMAFFNQPYDEKMKSNLHSSYGPGGYTPVGVESVARSRVEDINGTAQEAELIDQSAADAVESLVFNKGVVYPDALPETPADLVPSVKQYYSKLKLLVKGLHQVSATSLNLSESYFDPYYGTESDYALRLAFYPPFDCKGDSVEATAEGEIISSSSAPPPLRYGAHTDYQGFTVLYQDPHSTGLEVQLRDGMKI